MDADEKLTELKKAYADMILNTAKEAAGRIMVWEQKAHRLEFELKESKENALQMLTRLKQMIDSKINEAEMASRTQQKKIEELEAQLQEAEDIVKDLREELSSMHAELERTKPQTAVNPDSIPTSDVWNHDKDQSNKGQILYNSLFPFRKSYIHDQELPSIFLRSKGRKLYRSGCTHRIHACEGAPCEQTNTINRDLITETDEEGEKLHKEPSLEDEVKKIDHVADSSFSSTARSANCSKMEDSDESINTVTDLVTVSNVHRRLIKELLPMELKKTELPLASEAPVDESINTVTVLIRVSDVHRRLIEELLPMECEKTELPLDSEAPVDESINTVIDLIRVSDVHRRLIEELLPMECKKTELPLASEAPVDAPESKAIETDRVPIQLTSGRVIKYTFQRRRKRGRLSTNGSDLGNNMKKKEEDENALLETEKVIATENSTQEETEKVKSTQGENEKVISMEESTQEDTHLEKVAKQLIALSAKKW